MAEFGQLPNAMKLWPADTDPVALFARPAPIVLELGCGKAHFSVQLAAREPENNYIATDLKSDRLWVGATTALAQEMHNLHFVQEDVLLLAHRMPPQSISQVWITFPDPFPARTQAIRRMTHPQFQQYYRRMLEPNGRVNLKTDDADFFEYTLRVLEQEQVQILTTCRDVHATEGLPPAVYLKTHFEKRWLREGKAIHYLAYTF